MTRKKKSIAIGTAILLIAAACVGLWIMSWDPVNPVNFRRIKAGMSKAEVETILGGVANPGSALFDIRTGQHWGVEQRWGEWIIPPVFRSGVVDVAQAPAPDAPTLWGWSTSSRTITVVLDNRQRVLGAGLWWTDSRWNRFWDWLSSF